jgi:LacI family transcriptional regulator
MKRKRKGPAKNLKRVAVAILAEGDVYPREKILGLVDYHSKHRHWAMHRNQLSQPFVRLSSLKNWDGDGVVSEIYTQAERDIVDALSIPIVNTSTSKYAEGIPTVRVDHELVGEMGAKHLMECDVDSFVFVGPTDISYIKERYAGFKRTLERSKHKCSMVQYAPKRETKGRSISGDAVRPSELMDLLKDLPTPVGIMAASDRIGFAVLEACRRQGLRSPEDVAVVGVNTDEMYCMLAQSSLTSIDVQPREIGFRAAEMLDALMRGEKLKETYVLIPPKRVVFRDSTDMTRSEYPEVARALRFICNHAAEFIDVTNVLDVVPVSRRWLEMKFKDELGHGIYQEIRRVHVERAKELLITTQLSITQLSRECGFNSAERFEFSFQKLVGMSTSEFRESNKNKA